MLNELLADHKDDLIAAVMSKLGVSADQGGSFVQKLIEMAQSKISAGEMDLSALLQGDMSSLKSALNLEVLGSALGGGADKGEEALGAVIGPLKDKLGGLVGSGGDAGDLLDKITGGKGLGGIGGALGGMLGGKD